MSRDNKKAAGGGLRLFYRFRDNALSFYNLVRTRAAGIGHGDEICAVGLCAEVEREALRADGCGGIGHAHAAEVVGSHGGAGFDIAHQRDDAAAVANGVVGSVGCEGRSGDAGVGLVERREA